MDLAPSMVQRSGDKLIVRRVVSGDQVHLNEPDVGGSPLRDDEDHRQQQQQQQQQLLDGWRQEFSERSTTVRSLDESEEESTPETPQDAEHDRQLPQCKIKRNYSCGRCAYFTQNPREYLTHLRDTHGEKIVINECKRCLYASRHYQKLVRHMKMVHGSVDGIRKSSFGSRRRVQKGYLGGGGVPGKLLRPSEAERLTTAYVQQLMASGLPKLLEEIERSGASTSLGTSSFARSSSIHVDLEQLKKSLPYTSENQIAQEANEDDRREQCEDSPQRRDAEVDTKTKKRSRPIPNLIPLRVSPVPSTSGSVQRFVKPLPISALTAQNDPGTVCHADQEFPISLTKPKPTTVDDHEDAHTTGTKCIYCELSFKTVESLANHIKLAHKEDLIAYLLAHSFEEAEAKSRAVRQAEAGQANETWRRLVESGSAAAVDGQARRDEDTEASNLPTQVQPSTQDDTDDDSREGDGHQHQAQTFCGVETAPGYGEVTNRIPCVDTSSGGTALMKKVFKCPHCSFWASTASRFHVHIVGHLNKKPFECSLCAYRSNWRWDITKHIRLKTIRDPSHKNAGVLMNDETGRRNYTKYNKYVALMQITDK